MTYADHIQALRDALKAPPTPEQTAEFRVLLAKQVFRDDARRTADLFDRIQSDNRPN